MPKDRFDWSFTRFATPEQLRKEAEKWETIGNAAELDGDKRHAIESRRKAADLRQLAREKAVDEE